MLPAFALLLVLQLSGEVLVQLTQAPVPGPVVGTLLLFAGLLLRGQIPESLRVTGQTLLSHLALLFVPAGVGVLLYLPRIADEWLAMGVALLLSTLASIAAAALAMRAVMRWTGAEGEHD